MSRRAIAVVCAAAVVIVGVLKVTVRVQRMGRRPKRAAIGADTIVMLGDSLTEGGDWDALLPAWPIANRGYAGHTTAQLVAEAEEVASSRPRSVFILTGANDIRDRHPPSWTVDRLREILDRFDRDAPDTVVVLQTILPQAGSPRAVRETNFAIRQLAAERGLVVLDLHTAFDDGTGALRARETTDGVHLADPGYQRWATEVDEMLRGSGSTQPA